MTHAQIQSRMSQNLRVGVKKPRAIKSNPCVQSLSRKLWENNVPEERVQAEAQKEHYEGTGRVDSQAQSSLGFSGE